MINNIENEQDGLRLREQLKRAVSSEAVPAYLEAKIRNSIHSTEPKRSMLRWMVPATVALAVVLGVGIAYQLGHLRWTAKSQEAYNVTVSNRIASLMRVGLGDHIHCSVFRKFPKALKTPEELGKKLGAEYAGLIPILSKQVPADFRLAIAHDCRYHGRKFIHLSFLGSSGLVSLVITRKRDGESFETETLIPALTQSGIPIYRTGVQRFQIASFETRDHLAYFVSDLSQQQNTDIMVAIAPQVKELLAKVEG